MGTLGVNDHAAWEGWRAVIAALREKALPSMLEHADHLELHSPVRRP